MSWLCLHTLRADCNPNQNAVGVQFVALCLHTLRADCNWRTCRNSNGQRSLPPHAPCRLQQRARRLCDHAAALPPRAPCRLQRIRGSPPNRHRPLCLHALRADCNIFSTLRKSSRFFFASTRSVQIATNSGTATCVNGRLCLHALRADCNTTPRAKRTKSRVFASTRSVQIATAEMHRIAIYTFQNAC